MRMFIYGFVAIGLWFAGDGKAQSEVFRCEDPEQGIVFQQTPCPEPELETDDQDQDAADSDGELVAAAPDSRRRLREGDNVEDVLAAEQAALRESAEIKACKRQYREAIDAIDVEIRNSYTPEQKDYYQQRLKMLTDKMSECEHNEQ